MSSKLNTLVIHPEASNRELLKNASLMIPAPARLKSFSDLSQAFVDISRELGAPYDIAFISSELDPDMIKRFLRNSKQTLRGRDTAYILIVPAESQDVQTVARGLLDGSDGFLLEPYSVDSVQEALTLAKNIKDKRQEEREKAMLVLLANDAVRYLDHVATPLLEGKDPGRAMKQLKEIKDLVDCLDERLIPRFTVLVRNILGSLSAPEEKPERNTASKRLKSRMKKFKTQSANLDTITAQQKAPEKKWNYYRYLPEKGYVKLNKNLHSAEGFEQVTKLVKQCLQEGKKAIIFDFAEVQIINSYGMGQILNCEKEVKKSAGSLKIESAQNLALDAFRLFRLDELLSSESSIQ